MPVPWLAADQIARFWQNLMVSENALDNLMVALGLSETEANLSTKRSYELCESIRVKGWAKRRECGQGRSPSEPKTTSLLWLLVRQWLFRTILGLLNYPIWLQCNWASSTSPFRNIVEIAFPSTKGAGGHFQGADSTSTLACTYTLLVSNSSQIPPCTWTIPTRNSSLHSMDATMLESLPCYDNISRGRLQVQITSGNQTFLYSWLKLSDLRGRYYSFF